MIDPETFLIWLREEPNGVREVLGLNSDDFDMLISVVKFLFEKHSKRLFKMMNETSSESELGGQAADVLQFPGKKSNPFRLIVDNTKENGEV